jgi:hypothetical protein
MLLESFIASFGKKSGFDRVVADASRRACVRANIMRSSPISDECLEEVIADCSADVRLRIVERFDYDSSKGSGSTWVNAIAWFIGSNLVRDAVGESASTVRNVHSDSECRPGQAWDRLIHDHGIKDTRSGTDPDMADRQIDTISDSVRDNPRMSEFVRIAREEYTKDSSAGVKGRIAERLGVSNAQVSHYLNGLAEMIDSTTLAESVA